METIAGQFGGLAAVEVVGPSWGRGFVGVGEESDDGRREGKRERPSQAW
jgi:hypothetical protein